MAFMDYFTPREGTQENAKQGSLAVLESLLYFLVKSPYVLWTMSNKELREIREKNILDIIEIEKEGSKWPYVLYLVRFVIKFLIHCLIYLSLVLAPIAAIYSGISEKSGASFIGMFVTLYYAPVALRLIYELPRLIWLLIKSLWSYILILLKYMFFPAIVFYHFCSYLANKCAFKAAKYEKRKEDLNKAPEETK